MAVHIELVGGLGRRDLLERLRRKTLRGLQVGMMLAMFRSGAGIPATATDARSPDATNTIDPSAFIFRSSLCQSMDFIRAVFAEPYRLF